MNQGVRHPVREFVIDYDLMNYIDETVSAAIEDAVQETVDTELAGMIKGDGFRKRMDYLIDTRLRFLVQEITIKTNGAGPGRGHKGRTHRKISLSLPEPLYLRARELEGFLSCHVAAALELYLSLQKR